MDTAEHRIEELTAERDALKQVVEHDECTWHGSVSQVAALSAQVEAYRGVVELADSFVRTSPGRPEWMAYCIALRDALAGLSEEKGTQQ